MAQAAVTRCGCDHPSQADPGSASQARWNLRAPPELTRRTFTFAELSSSRSAQLQMFATARSDSDGRVVNGVAAVVLAAVLIGTLYVGREVFVPIALAILLSFVLAPLVRVLERWHIPRPISVVGVVLLAFASIFLVGGMIAAQVTQLAGDLPRYELTMREKIKSLRGATATSGTLERAADVLQDLGKELDRPKDMIPRSPIQTSVPGQEAKPIPVVPPGLFDA